MVLSSGRVVGVCSAITALYVPAVTLGAVGWRGLAALGRGAPTPLLLALLIAEILKLVFSLAHADPLQIKESKLPKARKSSKLKLRDIFKCILFLPICTAVFFFLIVLFGAPVATNHEETFVLASLLTILTVFPICFYAGVDSTISVLTGTKWFHGDRVAEMLQQNISLTLIGTWCGGIVIPLDWDRPWQAWPVPCYVGALIGYTISNFITLVKLIPFVAKKIAKKSKY